ncbi:hypothetical protein F4775DRAFT_174500 [Biscogniauxia sp. FL1348]|nr:hypothetical protein F4775DRAFT_174500 [Biscogniauxia sp. FL1348]
MYSLAFLYFLHLFPCPPSQQAPFPPRPPSQRKKKILLQFWSFRKKEKTKVSTYSKHGLSGASLIKMVFPQAKPRLTASSPPTQLGQHRIMSSPIYRSPGEKIAAEQMCGVPRIQVCGLPPSTACQGEGSTDRMPRETPNCTN